jgi:hypothetical protein
MNRNIGMILLAVYLILLGLTPLVGALSGVAGIMPWLALLAGVLILIGR